TWPLAILLFGLELILIVLWLLQVRDFSARRSALTNRPNKDATGADLPSDGPGPLFPNGEDRSRGRSTLIGRQNGEVQ
ncbi:MAG: hypothetical protein AAFR60_07580, partial [Pseudomonadota bacterium]